LRCGGVLDLWDGKRGVSVLLKLHMSWCLGDVYAVLIRSGLSIIESTNLKYFSIAHMIVTI
jgi:hypothetical protein